MSGAQYRRVSPRRIVPTSHTLDHLAVNIKALFLTVRYLRRSRCPRDLLPLLLHDERRVRRPGTWRMRNNCLDSDLLSSGKSAPLTNPV